MKLLLTIFGVGLVIAGIFAYTLTAKKMPGSNLPAAIVTITDAGYDKTSLDIKQGQTVNFVNNTNDDYWPASNLHPTHTVYPEFDPKEPVPAHQSWSFKFDKIGEWRFHDHLHPWITGVINVAAN